MWSKMIGLSESVKGTVSGAKALVESGMGDGFHIDVRKHYSYENAYSIVIMNYEAMERWEFIVPHYKLVASSLPSACKEAGVDFSTLQMFVHGYNEYGVSCSVNVLPSEMEDAKSIGKRRERLVYFMSCGDKVKIGMSNDPERRREEIQRMHPDIVSIIHTEPGGKSREMELHQRFNDLHSHGEWFEYGEEIEEYISNSKASSNQ